MRLTSEQIRELNNFLAEIDVVYLKPCNDFDHTEFCIMFFTPSNKEEKHLAPNGEITNE